MRFHITTDSRFPPNPDYIFDSCNTKAFRFIDLFSDTHEIFLYGSSISTKYFTGENKKKNVEYVEVLDEKWYENVDFANPDIMLSYEKPKKEEVNLLNEYNKVTSEKIIANSKEGDLVISCSGFTFSNSVPRDKLLPIINYSVGSYYAFGDFVIAESKYVKRSLSKRFITVDIKYVPPYFKDSDFPSPEAKGPTERLKNTYLYVGRCSDLKGLRRFMLLADYYKAHNLEGTFLIAGPAKTPSAEGWLRMTCHGKDDYEYNLTEHHNVKYVGLLDVKKRNELLRTVTAVIQTAEYTEPCGYLWIECMRCECPVIASNCGGIREIVEDGVTGYLVYDTLNEEMCIDETLEAMSKIDKLKPDASTVDKFFDKGAIRGKLFTIFDNIVWKEYMNTEVVDKYRLYTIQTDINISHSTFQYLRNLYHDVLYQDPDFHHFFEPYLILRVGSYFVDDVIEWIGENNLSGKKVNVRKYKYPYPTSEDDYKQGYYEQYNGIVVENFDYFQRMFHNNSVISILHPDRGRLKGYRERLIHTMYNQMCIIGNGESDELSELGNDRKEFNDKGGYSDLKSLNT